MKRIAIICASLSLLTPALAQPVTGDAFDALRKDLIAEVKTWESIPISAQVYISSLDEGRFGWDIWLDGDISAFLDTIGAEPTDDRFGQFVSWASTVHERLFELTKARVGALDSQFNPETDFELSVSGPVLHVEGLDPNAPRTERWEQRWARVAFYGSRLLSEHGPDIEVDHPPEDPTRLEGIELTVEVRLQSPTIAFREPLRGTVRATNTGTRRVPIGHYTIDRGLVVTTGEGTAPERFYKQLGTAHPPEPDWWVRFLEPGEAYQESFVLYADPGEAEIFGRGYHMPVGEYVLAFADLLNELNIPTVTEPVQFTVTGLKDEYMGPRSRSAVAAGDYLIMFREGPWLDCIDPLTGRRMGLIERDNVYLGSLWSYSTVCLSHDGRLAAFGSRRTDPVEWAAFYGPALGLTGVPMEGDLQPIHQNGGTDVIGFGASGSSLFVESDRGIIEISLESGEAMRVLPVEMAHPRVSPDGKFIVSTLDPQGRFADGAGTVIGGDRLETIGDGATALLTILPTEHPDDLRNVAVPEFGEMPFVTLGLDGAYLVHGQHMGVGYQPYREGESSVFRTGQVSVECESQDGTLVAFGSPGGPAHEEFFTPHDRATTIEVWDVASRAKLYEISGDGEHQEAFFVGSPPTLVVLIRDLASKPKWFKETARLYNGRTGEFQREVSIAPAGEFPKPAATRPR